MSGQTWFAGKRCSDWLCVKRVAGLVIVFGSLAGVCLAGGPEPKAQAEKPHKAKQTPKKNEKVDPRRAAIRSGLAWLAKCQQADGRWSFQHVHGTESRASKTNDMGATAMALLCFLAEGIHHEHPKSAYAKNVSKGLRFVLDKAVASPMGTDLRGGGPGFGGMYVQGMTTLALCETHRMAAAGKVGKPPGQAGPQDRTIDNKRIKTTAQGAVDFIVASQDPQGGGWRYLPRQAGDTSVLAWQMLALQSACCAGLRVPQPVFNGASNFLDSVADDGGAQYGYTKPQLGRRSTTAIGLLSRMYLGWKRDHAALARGIDFLASGAPAADCVYSNMFAVLALHHFGGQKAKTWIKSVHEGLTQKQLHDVPAAGSWAPVSKFASHGGPLYETAFSLLTLQIAGEHLSVFKPARD